jgi:hypothetical protein
MELKTEQSGYLVLGDVHAVYAPFARAVDYAVANDLTIVAVGDLVDNGNEGDMVVDAMLELIFAEQAHAIWGNHEWKVRRWLSDNSHPVGWPSKITISQFHDDRQFQQAFLELCNRLHDFISFNINGHSYFIAHAGFHPSFWEGELNSEVLSTFRNGMADYSKQYEWKDQIYPLRVYDWTEYVPEGVTAIVGHDPTPLRPEPIWDQFQAKPTVVPNNKGGKTIFLDCGAGKGGDLYGAVIRKSTVDTASVQKEIADLHEQLALTEPDSYDHLKISGDLELLDAKLKSAEQSKNDIEYINFGR